MNKGYAICLNEWALDKDIKDELGLLLIISSLCAENGYCFASNDYFAELFNISEVSVSRKIKLLEQKQYISIEYEYRGCEVISRKIRLTKMLIDDYQICKSTIIKNVKDNNTNIKNNKEIDNNKLLSTKKVFEKPTLEEVKQYCKERNNDIDAETFIAYYDSVGWKIGKKPMKNWKASIITWERNNTNRNKTTLSARELRDIEFKKLEEKYKDEN